MGTDIRYVAVREGRGLDRLRSDSLAWSRAFLTWPFRRQTWEHGELPEGLVEEAMGEQCVYRTHLRRGPRTAFFLQRDDIIFGAEEFSDFAGCSQGGLWRISTAAQVREQLEFMARIDFDELSAAYRVNVEDPKVTREMVDEWLVTIRDAIDELSWYLRRTVQYGLAVVVIDE